MKNRMYFYAYVLLACSFASMSSMEKDKKNKQEDSSQELLESKKGVPNLRDIQQADESTIRLLMKQYAQGNIDGPTTLMCLQPFAKKSQINCVDGGNNTFMHWAAMKQDGHLIDELAQLGVDSQKKNNLQCSPIDIIHDPKMLFKNVLAAYASGMTNARAIKPQLMKFHESEQLDNTDDDGNTFLHWAAVKGDDDFVKSLIVDFDFPHDIPNKEGFKPYDIAYSCFLRTENTDEKAYESCFIYLSDSDRLIQEAEQKAKERAEKEKKCVVQ